MELDADNDTSASVHGLVQVLAAALICLTLVDAVMVGINKSSLESSTRILFVRYGEWLFLPACAFVAWVARPFGRTSLMLLVAAYTTCYAFLTQFRGAWIWDGTFDAYEYSRLPWYRVCLFGIATSLLICCFPSRPPMRASRTSILLVLLTAATLLSAVMPRIWPMDSAFVSTRFLAMTAALLGLILLLFTSRVYE